MREEENRKLIRLKNNELISMTYEEVYKKFERLLFKLVNPWIKAYEYDELMQCATFGLYKAYLKYNHEAGTLFLTFAVRIIENEILMLNRRMKKHRYIISLYEEIKTDPDGNKLLYADALTDDVDYEELALTNIKLSRLESILNVLSERDKSMLKDYYINDLDQNDLASKYGITQPAISRVIKRSLSRCRKNMELKERFI